MSNEPIINPKVFYWIDVLDKLGFTSEMLFILSVVGVILLAVFYAILKCESNDEAAERASKAHKLSIILCIVMAIVSVLIPSKQTIYTMLIADQITPANIQYVGNSVEGCIDYMFDKVDDLIDRGDADD